MRCWKNRCLYSSATLNKMASLSTLLSITFILCQPGFYANRTYQIFKSIFARGEIPLLISVSFGVLKELWLQSFTEMCVRRVDALSAEGHASHIWHKILKSLSHIIYLCVGDFNRQICQASSPCLKSRNNFSILPSDGYTNGPKILASEISIAYSLWFFCSALWSVCGVPDFNVWCGGHLRWILHWFSPSRLYIWSSLRSFLTHLHLSFRPAFPADS